MLIPTVPSPNPQISDPRGHLVAPVTQTLGNTGTVVPVNVTGSKGANAALTSLIAALVKQGLISDSTS